MGGLSNILRDWGVSERGRAHFGNYGALLTRIRSAWESLALSSLAPPRIPPFSLLKDTLIN